jgi:hypothetical protein
MEPQRIDFLNRLFIFVFAMNNSGCTTKEFFSKLPNKNWAQVQTCAQFNFASYVLYLISTTSPFNFLTLPFG